MRRYRILLIVAVFTLLCIFSKTAAKTLGFGVPCKNCNVIIIVVDSLRADALDCQNKVIRKTPNLCRFAGQNITFPNGYANSTWTKPSNVSILTSLYPHQHGLTEATPSILNSNVLTLPKLLYKYGYQTTLVTNDQPHMAIELGLGRGFKRVKLTDQTFTNDTMDAWLSTIDSIKAANNAHQPAFVYFHTNHVHDYQENMLLNTPQYFPLDPEFHAPVRFSLTFNDDLWKDSIDYLTRTIQVTHVVDLIEEYADARNQLLRAKSTDEAGDIFRQLPEPMKKDLYMNAAQNYLSKYQFNEYVALSKHLYDDAVRTMDLNFAKILERIDQGGLNKNTVVIITSDHGDVFGEHGLIGHVVGITNEEIHIPLIMHVPNVSPNIVTSLTQHIDLFPTILDLIGKPVPRFLSGKSLIGPIFNSPIPTNNPFVVSETELPSKLRSIQSLNWRLVETVTSRGTSKALYNLTLDPQQVNPLANPNLAIQTVLSTILHRTMSLTPKYSPAQPTIPDSANDEERQQRINSGYYF